MESFEDALLDWRGIVAGQMALLTDEDPLADGHALLLHLIAQGLRQGTRVVCLASSFPEAQYTSVLRRLGVEKGKLDGTSGAFRYVSLLPTYPSSASTQSLFSSLAAMMTSLEQDQSLPTMIVIDDISVVAGVYGMRAAVDFVQTCRGLLLRRQPSNAGVGRQAASLLVRALGKENDECANSLSVQNSTSINLLAFLLRNAHVHVEVCPLASGYSRDVHGLITVRHQEAKHAELVNFKVGEGGIKCGRLSLSSARVGINVAPT